MKRAHRGLRPSSGGPERPFWAKRNAETEKPVRALLTLEFHGSKREFKTARTAISTILPFTVHEIAALIFRLDIAETVEQLDEVSARLRDEMVKELESRQN